MEIYIYIFFGSFFLVSAVTFALSLFGIGQIEDPEEEERY
jgi:hypothetical protein